MVRFWHLSTPSFFLWYQMQYSTCNILSLKTFGNYFCDIHHINRPPVCF
jgi:hypothetical protein